MGAYVGIMCTTKMLFVCFLFLATFQSVSANCRTISCYAKTGSSLTSSNLLTWSHKTCSPLWSMSCSRAHLRVPSRCNNSDKLKEACSKVCGSTSTCEKTVTLLEKQTVKETPLTQMLGC